MRAATRTMRNPKLNTNVPLAAKTHYSSGPTHLMSSERSRAE